MPTPSFARSARAHMLRSATAPAGISHLSGRSVLLLFSDIDHLTDGRDLMDMGKEISAQGATPIMAGPFGEMQHQLNEANCVALDVPLHRKGFFAERAVRRALSGLTQRTSLDLIHAIGPRAAHFGAQLAETYQVPYAATLAHPLSDHSDREAEALISAQRIFIANPEFTHEFLDMAPHVEERAQLAPHGVDLNIYSPAALRSAQIVDFVDRLRIPHHKPVLLVKVCEAGGAVQDLLLDALVDLAPLEFYPIIEFPVFSEKLRDRVERGLARRGLTHQVRLLDALEDPRPLYQIAEAVMIDAYRPYSFNRIIAEAGGFGKPVLAPLEDGIRAQVQHDVNGWLFTTQSHQTLKASMAKALTLPQERRKTMQAAAQLHVRTHFNAEATQIEILAAYEALLAAGQPFPGVVDMVDFDGDPLEIATPDDRGLSLIAEERKRRRGLSLRESSPAIRTALRERDTSKETVESRLAARLERLVKEDQTPEAAPSRAQQPMPAQPFAKPQAPAQPAAKAQPQLQPQPQPQPQWPSDVLPAPKTNFSLLDLAKKPGSPAMSTPRPAPSRPAVDVSGPLGSLLDKKPKGDDPA